MKYFGLLFDLDGTLVNSLGEITGVINRVRGSLGLSPLPEARLATFIGRGVESLIADAFPELSPEQQVSLVGKYREHYAASGASERASLYPGVKATLEKLRSYPQVRLAVCTNRATDLATRTLESVLPGIKFDFIAGPEMVSNRKPAPQHLLEVMAKLELDPATTWFVGDDRVDQECAVAAKVNFLAAGYGFGSVKKGDPSVTLNQFYDLLLHVMPHIDPTAMPTRNSGKQVRL